MTFQFRVLAPIYFVFEHLADMQKFAAVHPVIHRIEKVEPSGFLVHETLPLTLFTFSFTYPVQIIELIENKKVHLQATVFRIVTLNMEFHLSENGAHTEIEEVVDIQTCLPIHRVMYTIFKKMHLQLMQNIEKAGELKSKTIDT